MLRAVRAFNQKIGQVTETNNKHSSYEYRLQHGQARHTFCIYTFEGFQKYYHWLDSFCRYLIHFLLQKRVAGKTRTVKYTEMTWTQLFSDFNNASDTIVHLLTLIDYRTCNQLKPHYFPYVCFSPIL